MDIIKKEVEPFWSDSGTQIKINRTPTVTAKELGNFFTPEKRFLNYKRILAYFFCFLLLWLGVLALSLPQALRSIAYAKEGADLLQSGVQELNSNPQKAKELFLASSQSFQQAADSLKSLNISAKLALAFPQSKDTIHLMRSGYHLAATGLNLANIINPEKSTGQPLNGAIEEIISEKIGATNNYLDENEAKILETVDYLDQAEKELSQVNAAYFPDQYQDFITDWQKKLPALSRTAHHIGDLVKNRQSIFGDSEHPKKYLILFQNDTELRPAGGFLGSYATLNVAGDKVEKWWVQKNIYQQDKALFRAVEAPRSLQRFITHWAMRDSNWAIDYPEAAQEVANFYQLEGGEAVDGVIAIDTTIMEEILKLTGPIQVPGYDFTVDAESFLAKTQKEVELDYYNDPENKITNEPKTYIEDLSEVMAAAINSLPADKSSELLKIFGDALKRKSLLVNFTDPTLAAASRSLNIDGHVRDENYSADFLYIVNANLGGKKSSRNVNQVTEQTTKINSDNSVNHNLTITRQHQGDGAWPDGDNKNLMRILVPKGSELKSFDWQNNEDPDQVILVSEEAGFSAFEVWFETKIGQEKSLTIEYKTPTIVQDGHYSIRYPKQPGAQNLQLKSTISLPKEVKSYEASSQWQKNQSRVLETTIDQNQDERLEVEF